MEDYRGGGHGRHGVPSSEGVLEAAKGRPTGLKAWSSPLREQDWEALGDRPGLYFPPSPARPWTNSSRLGAPPVSGPQFPYLSKEQKGHEFRDNIVWRQRCV
ncbi:hypothetical protein VULLAG_LOCUS22803 [Vulpes lagopus]